MLKIGFNIEGSWDGFLIDFGTVLGAPEGSKMWFSLRRGTNFAIFAYLNISYLLDPSKYRFWVDLGGQVGHQNRTCWLQEGNLWCIKLLLGGSEEQPKMHLNKTQKKVRWKLRKLPDGAHWVTFGQLCLQIFASAIWEMDLDAFIEDFGTDITLKVSL